MKPEPYTSESVPSYSLPEPDVHFLASASELYDYGNLYRFTRWFRDRYSGSSGPDKPVVIISHSNDKQVFVIAACWLLGIPFAPLSPAQPENDLVEQIQRLNPGLIVAEKKYKKLLPEFEFLSINKKHLHLSGIDHDPSYSEKKPHKLMGYFLTSGSSGKPKIVPLKRRQMYYGAYASEQNFKPDANRYWLLCLPVNHVGGASIIIRSLLYGTAIYRMDKFDRHQVSTFLSENRLFQAASLVPTMLHRLLLDPLFQAHRELKAILLGGGPVTPALVKKSIERGLPVVQSYGMTETCAQIAANPLLMPSGTHSPSKSVGKLFAPNQIRIRDNQKKPLKINESGMIWLKGPQVFDGYLNKQDNRQAFDEDGWFNTGDYGHINAHGYIFIETRRSDLIVTGGENVNPVDVESALEGFEEIGQAAVIGIPDEEWGERVIAYIEPVSVSKYSFTSEKIRNRLREILPLYKIPKEIFTLKALPRTESGKIKRQALKEFYKKHSG
ncbi:MAG: AMP-binding protein [Balneolaceae bacterium]